MPPMDLALAAGVSLMVESFGKRWAAFSRRGAKNQTCPGRLHRDQPTSDIGRPCQTADRLENRSATSWL